MLGMYEIPECIRAIEPVHTSISMELYSKDGVLFPNQEYGEKYRAKCLDIYTNTSGDFLPLPMVVTMDFSGIGVLNYESALKSFEFPLRYFTGRIKDSSREFYSTYTNLSKHPIPHTTFSSPWVILQAILEGDHRRRPVVTLKCDGPRYSLMGTQEKVRENEQTWKMLLEEAGWVKGKEFIQKLDLPQMEFLNRLYRDGLALRAVYNETSYFRSIV